MFALLAAQQAAAESSLGKSLMELFYYLFMFGLVVLLSIVVTRLWVRRGMAFAPRTRHLQMLEYLPLGTGKGLYLVKVPEAVWIVSVQDGGVKVLKELPPSPDMEAPVQAAHEFAWPRWPWQLLKRKTDDSLEPSELPTDQPADFTRQLIERLREMKGPRT